MPDGRDYLIFRPDDVDLARSPLRATLGAETYVLGAFNPGLARLPNGNLLLMVRVAEALREPVARGHARAIRWTPDGYVVDAHPLDRVTMTDPRQFDVRGGSHRLLALTSLSWLLPVELDAEGREVVAVHYDRTIAPAAEHQHYGIEDARMTRIGDTWYMTACAVSAERHSTILYTSTDAMAWTCHGIVLDHQNKDMILFEGKVAGRFMALTRPLGELYFAPPPGSPFVGGPSINLAGSPDALHWKPDDHPFIRPRAGSAANMKVGGGSQPILTDAGWLMLYHGVETRETVGIYRTFWALLDRDEPHRILRLEDADPLIEADPTLTADIAHQLYLPTEVVFTTGIADGGADYIVASGEADLACRITRIPKARFA
ncbi:glycosidase [Sphingomonas solaris]|uniref:Glycosidase n=1 Tax=Alterirhizorhabdus solaris TaxID=2529389 RepID=A0A558R6H0_9SPHN|nr:glycosidase [Sphingomonas solaris]TVV74912.1 glycosidase [Sphingomonas solaris]